jgi:hypothetical protein
MLIEFMRKRLISCIFLLMIQALVFSMAGLCTEIVISPQMVARIYFDAYVAQDWEVVTEYMHPVLLQNLKTRIIEMLQEVSVNTRRMLLRKYQAQSIGEIEQMPARQLYILYLMDRWEGLDDQPLSNLENAEFYFIETVKINNEECLVEFKTSMAMGNQSYNKVQIYHMKKYDGKWKIYDTEGLKKLNTEMPSEQEIL